MKHLLSLLAVTALTLTLTGCLGNESTDNELIGQAKKAQLATPLICPHYHRVDVSLGVMRNGAGSMSTQDVWMYVPNDKDFVIFTDAVAKGSVVKVNYNVARLTWCVPMPVVTHVEVVE